MSSYVTAASPNASTTGVELPIDSLAVVLGYTGSNVTTFTVVYKGITYIKTLTYAGANVTAFSQWVPQ